MPALVELRSFPRGGYFALLLWPHLKFGRINGSYDNILDAQSRMRAVFDEVGRLAALPPEAWKPLVAPIAHNQRYLLCGGLRRTLVEHALQAARLARDLSAGSGTATKMSATRQSSSNYS